MEFFRYHGIWAPGVRLFRRCQFAAKAAIISAMFLAPMALLGWNYYKDKASAIDFSAKERVGVEYMQPLLPLLDAATKQDAASAAADAKAALSKVQQALGDELATATAHGEVLKARAAAEQITALNALVGQVSDGSNLTLDPDIDSYYVMDAVMFRLPPMMELLVQMRTAAIAARTEGPAAAKAQREFSSATAVFQFHLDNVRAGLAKAEAANPELKPGLKAQVLIERAAAVTASAGQALATGPAAYAAFDAAAQSFAQEQLGAGQRLLAALDGLLVKRVSGMEQQRFWVTVAVIVALILAVYLFCAFFFVTRGGLREVHKHLVAMTTGDLTTQPRPWGADEAASLMTSLAEMQDAFRGIVAQVRSASKHLVDSSDEIAGGAHNLRGHTERAAANVQQSATAMEEVARLVGDTASGAKEAAALAASNAEVATRGAQIIGSVVDTMRGIHASSAQIGEIIGTIDGLAFQTNILALNAAVEAARAGEQGRGFAVVAGEVRALAQRSALAAREIKSLITASLEKVQQGDAIVGQAGSAIDEMVGSAGRMNELLERISTGAGRQAAGVTQTARSVQEIDSLTQANTALVEQTVSAAASLKDRADELATKVASFRLAAGAAA
jgi:methyl-accepting chemotaxis protein